MWWAINLTTWFKATLLWREVQAGRWLETKLLDSERAATPESPESPESHGFEGSEGSEESELRDSSSRR